MKNRTSNPRFTLHPLTIAVSSALSILAVQAHAQDNMTAITPVAAPMTAPVTTPTISAPQAPAQNNAVVEVPEIEIVDEKDQPYVVDKISNPKVTQELVDQPKTVNIVTEQLLEDQGATTLEDALKNVSGVSTFGAGEGGGNISTGDVITIRGFDANGSIYSDGIRDVAGYSRDTFNTEQIEVAKGSSSTTAGKGSAGGTVNLVSKTANTQADSGSVSASTDSGDLNRISADYNQVLTDDSAIRLNVLGQEGGDYWGNGVENYETIAVALSYFKALNDKTNLTFNSTHMHQQNTPVLGLPFVTEAVSDATGLSEGPVGQALWSNYYGVEGLDFEDVSATTATIIVNHELNDNWDLRNQTRYGVSKREGIVTRPAFYDSSLNATPIYNSVANTNRKTEFADNTLFVTQFDAIGQIETDTVKHDIVTGFEVYQESLKVPTVVLDGVVTNTDTVDLVNPTNAVATSDNWTTDGLSTDIDTLGAAIYALDTISVGEKLQFSAGLRYEKFQVEGKKTSRGTEVEGKSDSDLFSWNVSANYKPTENGSIYVSAATAQQPNGSDLSIEGNATTVDEYAELDALESTTIEIGTKWTVFNQSLLLGGAIFDTTKDVYDADDDGTITTTGQQHNLGLELSAMGNITPSISISSSITLQEAEVTEDNPSSSGATSEGNGLTAAPDTSASLWLSYEKREFTYGFGAEYNSGITYWRRQMAYFETGDTTLLGAMMGYQVNDQLSAQVNISNLLNEAYLTDYSAKGHFLPGAPRNIKVSVNYTF